MNFSGNHSPSTPMEGPEDTEDGRQQRGAYDIACLADAYRSNLGTHPEFLVTHRGWLAIDRFLSRRGGLALVVAGSSLLAVGGRLVYAATVHRTL